MTFSINVEWEEKQVVLAKLVRVVQLDETRTQNVKRHGGREGSGYTVPYPSTLYCAITKIVPYERRGCLFLPLGLLSRRLSLSLP